MGVFDDALNTADRISNILNPERAFCPVDGVRIKGEALAAAMERRIGEDDRSSVISRLARAAGIEDSTVNQILNGSINCPPRSRLAGFARVLGVSVDSLIAAARSDGCSRYDNDE